MRAIVCGLAAAVLLSTAQAQQPGCQPDEILIEALDGPVRLSERRLSESTAAWNPVEETFLLTWLDDDLDLQGQRFNPDLTAFDPMPTELLGSPAFELAVAFNARAERYALAWLNQDSSVGEFNALIARVLDADTSFVGLPFALTGTRGAQESWLIASGDGFEVSSRGPIAVRRINASGTPGPASPELPTGSAPGPNGSVAHNPRDDEYLATWRNQTDGRLQGAILDSDLDPLVTSFVVSDTYPDGGRAAYTFWDERAQRYVVVFARSSDNGVAMRTVSPDGSTDPADIELIADGSVTVDVPTLASWQKDAGLIVHVRLEEEIDQAGRVIVRLFDGAGSAAAMPIELPTGAEEVATDVSRPLPLEGRDEVVFLGELEDSNTGDRSTALWRYRIARCPQLFSDGFEPAMP